MKFDKAVKLSVWFIVMCLASVVIYRLMWDENFDAAHIGGIAVVGGLAMLFVVLDRVQEFTAGTKGISAKLENKLEKLNSEISDIHNFMLKGIDRDSSEVLRSIKKGRVPKPNTSEEKDLLKFRLRVLREKAYILRDESKCGSVSDAVKNFENVADCFVITELGEEHIRHASIEAIEK